MATAHVTYHYEPGSWWIESAEYPGYTAFAASRDEATQLAREGLPFFADDPGLEIVGLDAPESWTTSMALDDAATFFVEGLVGIYIPAGGELALTGQR